MHQSTTILNNIITLLEDDTRVPDENFSVDVVFSYFQDKPCGCAIGWALAYGIIPNTSVTHFGSFIGANQGKVGWFGDWNGLADEIGIPYDHCKALFFLKETHEDFVRYAGRIITKHNVAARIRAYLNNEPGWRNAL